MKILLASLHHVEYAVELAVGLSCRHDVHLLLSRERIKQTIGKDELVQILFDNNVQYTFLKKYPGRNLMIFSNFMSVFKLLNRFNPDIIHIQESSDIQYLALSFSWAPIVVTVHDVLPHFGTQFRYNRIHWFIRKYLYRKIIVHGKALKETYLKHFPKSPDNIFSIPHGSLFSFSSAEKKLKEEEHTILFFGRIEKYKGLEYLIEASIQVAKKHPDLKVIVAGKGEDLRNHKLRIQKYPFFEIHDEFIPNAKVADLFNRASLVVLPYVEASQSGVVAMAYAFNKPIIASSVGSIPEMVINGKTGFIVPPKNANALAECITYLLNNRQVREAFSKEISMLTANCFGWGHIAMQTEKVYSQMVL